jgi:hypothetical protein
MNGGTGERDVWQRVSRTHANDVLNTNKIFEHKRHKKRKFTQIYKNLQIRRNKQNITVLKGLFRFCRDAMHRVSTGGLKARKSLAQGNALWPGNLLIDEALKGRNPGYFIRLHSHYKNPNNITPSAFCVETRHATSLQKWHPVGIKTQKKISRHEIISDPYRLITTTKES